MTEMLEHPELIELFDYRKLSLIMLKSLVVLDQYSDSKTYYLKVDNENIISFKSLENLDVDNKKLANYINVAFSRIKHVENELSEMIPEMRNLLYNHFNQKHIQYLDFININNLSVFAYFLANIPNQELTILEEVSIEDKPFVKSVKELYTYFYH